MTTWEGAADGAGAEAGESVMAIGATAIAAAAAPPITSLFVRVNFENMRVAYHRPTRVKHPCSERETVGFRATEGAPR